MTKTKHKCVRCGQCCVIQICETGVRHLKAQPTDSWKPCPLIRKEGKIHSCGLLLDADDHLKDWLKASLAIGQGCMNELKREVTFLKKKKGASIIEEQAVSPDSNIVKMKGLSNV